LAAKEPVVCADLIKLIVRLFEVLSAFKYARSRAYHSVED